MELTDDRLPAALDRLIDRGVLDRRQADAVLAEVAGAVPPPRPALRRIFGEVAGYLGASFVVGATVLFLAEEWDSLGRTGRVTILAAMAMLLFGAGLAARWRGADDVRRRLASTLLTGGAVAAAFTAHAALESPQDETAPLIATLAGLVVVIGGYLLARSAVGQLGVAAGAFAVYLAYLDLIDLDRVEAYGLGIAGLGLVWAGLAGWRLVREHRLALAVAVTYGLAGAQILVIGDGVNHLGHLLTALVAAACFAAYLRIREWVVLAGGVIGATLVVPQFLYDVTDGSLGVAGVLLVAGMTLLGGSLLGLRIRRAGGDDRPAPGATAEPEHGEPSPAG